MPAKPTTHLELIEPLQSFLESLAQDLTEHKFVPALQGELQKLQGALEGLEQAESTLQQIARGVDRLREVFAPAGTRLLEGVKDVESILRSNAGQLREQADGVLQDLLSTHEQLEAALRNEANTLSEQTSVSREALNRTIADVDARLVTLNAQVDTLCHRLDSESAPMRAVPALMAAGEAGAPMTGDLRDLVVQSEQAIGRELTRHHQALSETLVRNQSDERERLVLLDQRVEQALTSVGPRVHEELESAVLRLRDQLQTLLLAELETRTTHAEPHRKGAATASAPELTAALTASETRILRELSTLEKEQGEALRVVRDLAKGLETSATQSGERALEQNRQVRESLVAVQKLLTDAGATESERQRALHDQLNQFASGQGMQKEQADQAAVLFDEHDAEMRLQLTGLSAAVERVAAAALAASEKSLGDSRQQHERIESTLRDLRQQLDGGLSASEARLATALQLARDEWLGALQSFREFTDKALAEPVAGLQARVAEIRQQNEATRSEFTAGLREVGTGLDQRLDKLQNGVAGHRDKVEHALHSVSDDVGALRAGQEQTQNALKDAIRANYDENAARLRELIEAAYENFARQISQVPQALERYTHLLQSLHQGDQLALQAITSDTRNIIALAGEKFELLINDSSGVKKFLPLLDRKLEKHSAAMDAVRKAQVRQDKDLADLNAAVAAQRSGQSEHMRDLRGVVNEQFTNAQAAIDDVQSQLKSLADDGLPGLRRDLIGLISGKFEFIEGTLQERQDTLRRELFARYDAERKVQQRISLSLAVLLALSVGLQIFFHVARTPGVGQ